jgi:hypothetical protein
VAGGSSARGDAAGWAGWDVKIERAAGASLLEVPALCGDADAANTAVESTITLAINNMSFMELLSHIGVSTNCQS